MRVLLDTHVALWVLQGGSAIGPRAEAMIREADTVHVSAASIWEIAIKHSIGKLGPPEPVVSALAEARIDTLDVRAAHAVAVTRSPLEHHDPFDRLIAAQAQVEGCTLCTADAKILSAAPSFTVDARR